MLQYFAAVIKLNVKRAGMQVDPDTVASDSFMLNLQSVLFRFCEPFMDANYSKVREIAFAAPFLRRLKHPLRPKIERIDPFFYAHSKRIVLDDETRIKATSEEANAWASQNKPTEPPNFISNVFFLCIAMAHYGYLKTVDTYNGTHKHLEDIKRHLNYLEGDRSWQGVRLDLFSYD